MNRLQHLPSPSLRDTSPKRRGKKNTFNLALPLGELSAQPTERVMSTVKIIKKLKKEDDLLCFLYGIYAQHKSQNKEDE